MAPSQPCKSWLTGSQDASMASTGTGPPLLRRTVQQVQHEAGPSASSCRNPAHPAPPDAFAAVPGTFRTVLRNSLASTDVLS